MEVTFDAVIKNEDCPASTSSADNFNWATFEPMSSQGYDIQFFTNEYFINNAFWALFYAD
jgi:hypothetical protein